MSSATVVGYDGSREAKRAMEYATGRVDGVGELFVVAAVSRPPDFLRGPELQHFIDSAHSHGEELLAEALAYVPVGTSVEAELLEGDPAEAIVKVADVRHADEIVVGSRGRGRVRSVLGSVSHDVLHLAHVPVVVVPPEGD